MGPLPGAINEAKTFQPPIAEVETKNQSLGESSIKQSLLDMAGVLTNSWLLWLPEQDFNKTGLITP